MRRYKALGIVAAAGLLGTSLAACGGSSDDKSSGGGAGAGVPASVAANLKAATEGTNDEPTVSGLKPASGKKITLVSFGNQGQTGPIFTKGFKEAVKTAGWELSAVDGQFSTDIYLKSIRQAIAEKSDAIVLYVIDCASVRAGVEEAKAAGIPIFYVEAYDCNATDSTADATGFVNGTYNTFEKDAAADYTGIMEASGALQADAGIAAHDGKMNALVLDFPESAAVHAIATGFLKEAKVCDCKTTVVTVPFADFGEKLQQKVQTALLKDPSINTVMGNYDDAVLNGAGSAVRASGRKIYITGEAGYPPALDLIRAGGMDMTIGYDLEQEAWSVVEAINMRLHGKTDLPSTGVGLHLIDAKNNLPAAGKSYSSGIDFKSKFTEAWGAP